MKILRLSSLGRVLGVLVVLSLAACSPDTEESNQPPVVSQTYAARIKKQVWFTTEIKIPKGEAITNPAVWAVYNGYSFYREDQSYHFVDSLDHPLEHGTWSINESDKTLLLKRFTGDNQADTEVRKIVSLDDDRFVFTVNNALTGGQAYEVRQVAVYDNPDPGLIGEVLVQLNWQVVKVYRIREGQPDLVLNKEEFPADRYAGILRFDFENAASGVKNKGVFKLTSYPDFGQGTRVIKRGDWEISSDGKMCYWTLKNAQGDITGRRELTVLKATGEAFVYLVKEGDYLLRVEHKAINKE